MGRWMWMGLKIYNFSVYVLIEWPLIIFKIFDFVAARIGCDFNL